MARWHDLTTADRVAITVIVLATIALWTSLRILSPGLPFWAFHADGEIGLFYDSFNVLEGRPQVLWQGGPFRVLGAGIIAAAGLGPLDIETFRPLVHLVGLGALIAALVVLYVFAQKRVPRVVLAVAVLGYFAFPSSSYFSGIATEDMFFFPLVAATLLFTWRALEATQLRASHVFFAAAAAGLMIAWKWTTLAVFIGALVGFAVRAARDPSPLGTGSSRPYRVALTGVGVLIAGFATYSATLGRIEGNLALEAGLCVIGGLLTALGLIMTRGRPARAHAAALIPLGFLAVAVLAYALASFPLRERWRDVIYLARTLFFNSGPYGTGTPDLSLAVDSILANSGLAITIAPLSVAFLAAATMMTAVALVRSRTLTSGDLGIGIGLLVTFGTGAVIALRPASVGPVGHDPGLLMRYLFPIAIAASVALLWSGARIGARSWPWVLAAVVLMAATVYEHGRTITYRNQAWAERQRQAEVVGRRVDALASELGRRPMVLELAIATPAGWLMRYDAAYAYGAHQDIIRKAHPGFTFDEVWKADERLRALLEEVDYVLLRDGHPTVEQLERMRVAGSAERLDRDIFGFRPAR